MGFFKDFKDDMKQAVNELIPGNEEMANEYDDEDMVNTLELESGGDEYVNTLEGTGRKAAFREPLMSASELGSPEDDFDLDLDDIEDDLDLNDADFNDSDADMDSLANLLSGNLQVEDVAEKKVKKRKKKEPKEKVKASASKSSHKDDNIYEQQSFADLAELLREDPEVPEAIPEVPEAVPEVPTAEEVPFASFAETIAQVQADPETPATDEIPLELFADTVAQAEPEAPEIPEAEPQAVPTTPVAPQAQAAPTMPTAPQAQAAPTMPDISKTQAASMMSATPQAQASPTMPATQKAQAELDIASVLMENALSPEATASNTAIQMNAINTMKSMKEAPAKKVEHKEEAVMAEDKVIDITSIKEPEKVETPVKKEPIKTDVEGPTGDEEVSESTTYVTKGTRIEGNIFTDGSLDLLGTIEGDVNCYGKLIISGGIKGKVNAGEIYANAAKIEGEIVSAGSVKVGVGSVIIGNIDSSSAVVAGAVNGDLDVKGPVIVDSTAVIMGNIKSRSVQINNGAIIEGFCSQCYSDIDVKSFFA